jgi:SPP1 family predicted phage head-tail adaptor
MESGKLRNRVIFQSGSAVAGEGVTTWSDTLTVWGMDRQLVGTRLYEAMQQNSKIKGEVVVRYNSLINSSMRMKIGTRYLRIISIINIENRNVELVIPYEEWID